MEQFGQLGHFSDNSQVMHDLGRIFKLQLVYEYFLQKF
jgi:hypothetical protein